MLVPWERVFIHRDPELCNGLYNRTGIMPQIMHQFSTKNLAKAEFMMGLDFAIAKSTNIDRHLHVQGSYAELAGPASVDVATYFQAANADAATRIKLFRLAFDAAVSSFWGRQQLYERYYSGDPVRLAGTLYGLYDKETQIDRIIGLLDDLEGRRSAGGLESAADRPPWTG